MHHRAARDLAHLLQPSQTILHHTSLPTADNGGGLFGWPPKPWTNSGRAPPQPLLARGVAAERTAAAAVRQVLEGALHGLPTSILTDIDLLLGAGGTGSGAGAALSGRVEAAVRCRLEHKLLLREGVRVMEEYEAALEASVRLG